MIDPTIERKLYWDIFITAVLLYSCTVTTVQMALFEDLSLFWKIMNYMVDFLFLIDIIVIFNTALQDEDGEIIEDRYKIASTYLKGWFLIDLIAIIPFELMFRKGESANLIRYTRIGRMYKMLKLMKLVRLMKLQKNKSFSILDSLQDFLQISQQFKWFFVFFFYFGTVTHIVSCFWIIVGNLDDSGKSWISLYGDVSRSDLYLTSFYFTITTITTVGYGDFSAKTFAEKIICIFIMITGVIAFSFAASSLTNFMQK